MSEPLIVCLDVDYRPARAVAAGVWFRGWAALAPDHEASTVVPGVPDYEPGAFYRRELPCLLAVLPSRPAPDIIVVDGYAWLGPDRPGLGAHLYEALGRAVPVIGVAKTRFHSADAVPVVRGTSRSPLYVTAAGADVHVAADWVRSMSGPYRVPDLLGRVDRLARTADVQDSPDAGE